MKPEPLTFAEASAHLASQLALAKSNVALSFSGLPLIGSACERYAAQQYRAHRRLEAERRRLRDEFGRFP